MADIKGLTKLFEMLRDKVPPAAFDWQVYCKNDAGDGAKELKRHLQETLLDGVPHDATRLKRKLNRRPFAGSVIRLRNGADLSFHYGGRLGTKIKVTMETIADRGRK